MRGYEKDLLRAQADQMLEVAKISSLMTSLSKENSRNWRREIARLAIKWCSSRYRKEVVNEIYEKKVKQVRYFMLVKRFESEQLRDVEEVLDGNNKESVPHLL